MRGCDPKSENAISRNPVKRFLTLFLSGVSNNRLDVFFPRTSSSAARVRPARHEDSLTPPMFLLTPHEPAAVITANCTFGKVWVTARWHFYEANKLLGNLGKKASVLPDTTGINELKEGHLKQNETWKRHKSTQLNEAEWSGICLPLLRLYFASSGVENADLACSITARCQVGVRARARRRRLPVAYALRRDAVRRTRILGA